MDVTKITMGMMFVLIVLLIILLIIYNRKSKSYNNNKLKVTHTSGKNIYFRTYLFLSRFPVTKKYMKRIKNRIMMLSLADEFTVGKNAVIFVIKSFTISFIVFLVFSISGGTLYYLLIGIVFAAFVNDQITNISVDSLENKLLNQFEKFLGDVRHHYHEHGMIDEAVFDSIEDCEYEMAQHAQKFSEILESSNIEDEVENYVAPNKFFRTFLALCETVLKYDDKKVDDKSTFLTNLEYLKNEVNTELLKRRKTNYLLRSFSIITIVPIFTLKPLERWSISNMPEMASFYKGSYGFVITVFIFVWTVLGYQLVNKIQMNIEEENPLNSFIEDKLLKVKLISNLVDKSISRNYSKALKYLELMKNTGSQVNIKVFYLKRMLYAFVTFCLGIILFLTMYSVAKTNIINTVADISTTTANINTPAAKALSQIDTSYIEKYKDKNPTYDQVKADIKATTNVEDNELLEITTKRVYAKINDYNSQYFKWWQLLVCYFLSFIAYNMPYLILKFKKMILQLGMEDEVMQFQSIIMMLMYIERIDVESILQWMLQFAMFFKSSIAKCLNDYEYDDIGALEQLKIDEPYLPFARIIENLEAAAEKISIRQAFDELNIERGFYLEKRKTDNEIIINKKANIAKIIAFSPLVLTMIFYLIVPFVIFAIHQLMSYSAQFGSTF